MVHPSRVFLSNTGNRLLNHVAKRMQKVIGMGIPRVFDQPHGVGGCHLAVHELLGNFRNSLGETVVNAASISVPDRSPRSSPRVAVKRTIGTNASAETTATRTMSR